jgi:hypothetical protein
MFLSINQYIHILSEVLSETGTLFGNKNYYECEKRLLENIRSTRTVLKERPWGEFDDFYNNILILGIISKCFLDLLELIRYTANNNWFYKNKQIEDIWSKMVDCKERLLYVKEYLTEEYFEFIRFHIINLENVYRHNFGDALYMSTEFIYDPICSICLKDLRSCEHERNRIYNGKLCKVLRKNLIVESYNLVHHPFDHRCRIWPWNINTKENSKDKIDTTFSALVFTIFAVDNFLDEEKMFN